MKTISKNARLSLTVLVFGAALISGVESKAMDGVSSNDAAIMYAIGQCLKKAGNAQVADASGFKIDPVATARQQRIDASDCLNKLPDDYKEFNNGWGGCRFEKDQNGNLKPVLELVNDSKELTALFVKTSKVYHACSAVENADYVSAEAKNKARIIRQKCRPFGRGD